ncbi:MAG: RDD family protein [Bacteroidota bacterium]
MENEFAKVMSERTDNDLIKIVTIEREKYNPNAIAAAENEIEKRKIDTTAFEQVREKITIEKTRQETVEKNVVSSLTRFWNFLIDILVWFIIASLLSSILDLFIQTSDQFLLHLLGYTLIFGSFIAYYAIMEIKYQKTVGKFITKTKVVKMDGTKPDSSDIVGRTFCRLIPFDRISFLFVKNGFHDYLSKTKVVKDVAELKTNGNNI